MWNAISGWMFGEAEEVAESSERGPRGRTETCPAETRCRGDTGCPTEARGRTETIGRPTKRAGRNETRSRQRGNSDGESRRQFNQVIHHEQQAELTVPAMDSESRRNPDTEPFPDFDPNYFDHVPNLLRALPRVPYRGRSSSDTEIMRPNFRWTLGEDILLAVPFANVPTGLPDELIQAAAATQALRNPLAPGHSPVLLPAQPDDTLEIEQPRSPSHSAPPEMEARTDISAAVDELAVSLNELGAEATEWRRLMNRD